MLLDSEKEENGESRVIMYREALNEALKEEMRRDPLFTLLYYFYEDAVKRGDIQGLNQFVLKYWLHNHSLSFFGLNISVPDLRDTVFLRL